ncbi:MAG: serine/threonine protein kinase, partial [Myxococcota bacterium]
ASRRSLRDRFLTEARVMACLRHPNIVRATDTISAPGIAGIVMDFIEGGSLGAWMDAATAPPGPADVRRVFLPVLDALHHAHLSGVIHRDIKPANILLEILPGGGARPLLTDFGVARVRGEIQRAGEGNTAVGTRMGTLGYMSPEQIRSAAEVDARSDVFSLAVTLFEFATLQRLFDGKSEYDIMQAIVTGDVHIPEVLRQRDPRLAEALRRALDTDPDRRFPDCAAFARAIGDASAPPMAARPPPLPPPEPPPAPVPPPPVLPAEDEEEEDVVVRAPPAASPGVLGRLLRPGTKQPAAALIYQPDTPEQREIPIHGDRMLIGKAPSNDIRLPRDSWVSRYHCRLERGADGWVLRDNTTVHGTMVDGELVLSLPLSGGELITVGRTPFRFVLALSK